MPRVSIIVPAYNAGRFIERCLRSALEQTFSDHEVIVIDDGSTDDTADVVARFGTSVRYVRQGNSGVASARNTGLSLADGQLIAYLDADDEWYPDRLEAQVALLDAHPRIGLVHADIDTIDENGRLLCHGFSRSTGRPVPQGDARLALLQYCHIQTLTVLVRRSLVDRAGGFDERLTAAEDYLQWIRIALCGAEFGYIDRPLARYRSTEGGLSRSNRRMQRELIAMLRILLAEEDLAGRCGPGAVDIVRQRIHILRRNLAYMERIEGRAAVSRELLLQSMREHPLTVGLYTDFLKSTGLGRIIDRASRWYTARERVHGERFMREVHDFAPNATAAWCDFPRHDAISLDDHSSRKQPPGKAA